MFLSNQQKTFIFYQDFWLIYHSNYQPKQLIFFLTFSLNTCGNLYDSFQIHPNHLVGWDKLCLSNFTFAFIVCVHLKIQLNRQWLIHFVYSILNAWIICVNMWNEYNWRLTQSHWLRDVNFCAFGKNNKYYRWKWNNKNPTLSNYVEIRSLILYCVTMTHVAI